MKKYMILLLPAAVLSGMISFAATPDSTSLSKIEYGRSVEVDRNEASAAVSSAGESSLSHKTSINPSNLLYGLIPGLQVLQNAGNAWDDGATLYVRGIGTSGTASPLILVDGFERSLDKISSRDIESVTVLKDASSASIYGARAALICAPVTPHPARTSRPFSRTSMPCQAEPRKRTATSSATLWPLREVPEPRNVRETPQEAPSLPQTAA